MFPLSRLRHRRAPVMERAAACQRWLQRAFVLLFDYMRLWGLLHFNPRGVDASTPGPRFVMVANHPTLVDLAALSAVFGRFVCVAKPLLFRAPMLGQVLRACVYLEGGEIEGLAVAAVVTQALERLAQSMPMLVFPEGTRSPTGGLRPFRRGAVRDRLPRERSRGAGPHPLRSTARWERGRRGTIFRLERHFSR